MTVKQRLITTKNVTTITIIVVVLTILSVWISGLGQHRSLFENSILSTSILATSFFLFLFIGLYKGVKLKDDIGKITSSGKQESFELPEMHAGVDFPSSAPDIGGDIEDIIFGIFAWIIFSIVIIAFTYLFGIILWLMIALFAAMLYWIFFRALRLVFKNSNKCKGNLVLSLSYSFTYTLLYTFWIYTIILGTHYLAK